MSVQRTIQIDHKDLDSVAEAKKELKKQIKAVEKDPSLVDSPISTAVNLEFVKQSSDPELKAIAEFRSALEDINATMKEIRDRLEDTRRRSEPKLRFRSSYPESTTIRWPVLEGEQVMSEEQMKEIVKRLERFSSEKGQTKKKRSKKD